MGIFWTMEFFIYISELWVVKIEEMYKIKKKYTQERYGQILDFPSFFFWIVSKWTYVGQFLRNIKQL